MSGVLGQPLPSWAPELKPCGTPAAYKRHLRRGEPVDESCRQAMARDWQDRVAVGLVRRSRGRVHLASGPGKCYCRDVAVTDDPEQVTCQHCLAGYRSRPRVRAATQAGEQSRAA